MLLITSLTEETMKQENSLKSKSEFQILAGSSNRAVGDPVSVADGFGALGSFSLPPGHPARFQKH